MEGKVQGKVISCFSARRLQAFLASQLRELTVHYSAGGAVCLDSGLPGGLGKGGQLTLGKGWQGLARPAVSWCKAAQSRA